MLVVEYLVASCNLVCDQKVGGYDIIKKSLVLKICDWLLAVSNRDPKYTNLVQMENTFWMMEEIQRIQLKYEDQQQENAKVLLDLAQAEISERYKKAFDLYVEENMEYHFNEKLTQKQIGKSNQEVRILFEKVFPKKEKVHEELKKMMKRVSKHLTAGNTDPAINGKLMLNCRKKLIEKLEIKVHTMIPEMVLTPWPEPK